MKELRVCDRAVCERVVCVCESAVCDKERLCVCVTMLYVKEPCVKGSA